MKLCTSITPRADKTVIVHGKSGTDFVFQATAESDGELVCDVDCEATLKHLLRGDDFYPASPEDFAAAQALIATAASNAAAGVPAEQTGDLVGEGVNTAAKADEDLDLDDDEGDTDALPLEGAAAALPVEANTPPSVAPDRAARSNTAAQRRAASLAAAKKAA